MKTPQDILDHYRERSEKLKAAGSPYKEIQPLSIPDVLSIRVILHPTNRKASKEMTKQLILLLCEKGIMTAEEIYAETGFTDKPVLQRLRKFRELGLVRREHKKYYMSTDRMLDLKNRYLERVCGE